MTRYSWSAIATMFCLVLLSIFIQHPLLAVSVFTMPSVLTNGALQNIGQVDAPFGVVRRGVNTPGDVPGQMFTYNTVSCSTLFGNALYKAGDVGSCVAAIDGGSWRGMLAAPIAAEQFGVTYPFVLNVTASLCSDNAYGFVVPVCTTQRGVTAAGRVDFRGLQNFMVIGPGSFPGFIASGSWLGEAGPQISGPYLIVQGAGSGVTNITTPGGSVSNIILSTHSGFVFQKMNIVLSGANVTGIFLQAPGSYFSVPGTNADLVITGNDGTQSGIHTENISTFELSCGASVTFQGVMNFAFAVGQMTYIEIDPCSAGTHVSLGVGTGLTANGWFLQQDMAHVYIGAFTTIAQLTGPFAALQRGSVMTNASTSVAFSSSSTLGTISIDESSQYFPPGSLAPTGPSAGCGGAGLAISGGDRSGAVTMGAAPGATCSYALVGAMSNNFACWAQNATSNARNPVGCVKAGTGFTLSGTFLAGDVVYYQVKPYP